MSAETKLARMAAAFYHGSLIDIDRPSKAPSFTRPR